MESAIFIICSYYYAEIHSIQKPEEVYKKIAKNTRQFAIKGNRELAEGPTHLITDNYYGPVELWPLVMEVDNDFSRAAISTLRSWE